MFINLSTPVLLADAAASPLGGLVPLILMFVVFYLIVILPQQRQDKQRRERVNAVKKGDTVVLEGGIIGRVTNPDAGAGLTIVEIADRTRVKVIKEKIVDIHGGADAKKDEASAKKADSKKSDSKKSDDQDEEQAKSKGKSKGKRAS